MNISEGLTGPRRVEIVNTYPYDLVRGQLNGEIAEIKLDGVSGALLERAFNLDVLLLGTEASRLNVFSLLVLQLEGLVGLIVVRAFNEQFKALVRSPFRHSSSVHSVQSDCCLRLGTHLEVLNKE